MRPRPRRQQRSVPPRFRLWRSVGVAALLGGASLGAMVAAGVASEPAAAREIGAVAAANPTIEGSPPDAELRRLIVGVDVVENERIVTSSAGSGQILFDDQTTLTVAPGSDIVLDRYVYDPDAGTGQIGLSLAKGAVRFIGGRLSKEQDAVVRTPTATIGIRGGMALISVDENGKVQIVNLAAAYVRVESTGETFFLSRQGAAAEIVDGEIVYLGVADAEVLDRFYAAFETGGGGGAARPPSDDEVVQSGVPEVGFDELGSVNRAPVSTEGGEPVETPLLEPIVIGTDFLIEQVPEPETPVVLIGTPLPDSSGSGFFADTAPFTTFDGDTVFNPSGTGVFFTDAADGSQPFVGIFEGSRIGVTGDGTIIRIPTPDDKGFFAFNGGADDLGGLDDTVSGRGFFDPIDGTPGSDFTIALLSLPDVDAEEVSNDQIGAVVIGTPTPNQLLDVTADTGGATLTRSYDMNFRIRDGNGGRIFPDNLGIIHSAGNVLNNELTVVGDSSGALFGAAGTAGDAQGGSVASLVQFEVYEQGGEQRSFFGGFATPWRSNGDAPTLSAGFFGTGQEASESAQFSESIAFTADVGTIEDGSDENNVFYGPDGEYIVLGTSGRYFDEDDEVDFGNGLARTTGDPETGYPSGLNNYNLENQFGFVAFGALSGDDVELMDASRFTVASTAAADVPEKWADSDGVFTGGFAGGIVITETKGEDGRPDVGRALVNSTVTATFDAETNRATLEIPHASVLLPALEIGGAADDGGASALVTDRDFVSTVSRTEIVDDPVSEAEIDRTVNAIAATSEASGVPTTIFPTGTLNHKTVIHYDVSVEQPAADPATDYTDVAVDTAPEYLTWGHWSHEVIDTQDGETTIERVHAGAWIAGDAVERPDELPMTGVVRHAGFAEVTVHQDGAQYIDGGGYHLTYDFKHQQGQASFRDLGGYDFNSNVVGTDGGIAFQGGLDAVQATSADVPPIADITGSVQGGFFAGGNASAGNIQFQDAVNGSLSASGVFGGAADGSPLADSPPDALIR